METLTLTAAEFADAYESGRLHGANVTKTLRAFSTNHEFLIEFASAVAKLRNVDSSAKLGDLASALKNATKESESRLTFSFKKNKAYFGQAAGFSVSVIPYVAPTKDDSADALAALEKLGKYFGSEFDSSLAEASLVILDRIEVSGQTATARKNAIRDALNSILSK